MERGEFYTEKFLCIFANQLWPKRRQHIQRRRWWWVFSFYQRLPTPFLLMGIACSYSFYLTFPGKTWTRKRKKNGRSKGRRFRLHSHFKSLFPFFEQKKIIKIIISLLILSSIMVIQWHPNPDCLFMFDHIRTCSLNWCWRRKWLLDKENVLSALYLAFQRCRQVVNKSWIDNDEKKRNPFEMIYNARMFHWRRGTLTARHYNLSSDNDDDDDDNGDDEMRRWHHTGAEWRGKKSQWTGKKTTAVHARAYNTIVAVVVKLR